MKKSLKVICIKNSNSIKLIKGATYLATDINRKKVYLDNVGSYDVENFILESNGKNLATEPDFRLEENNIKNDVSYIGQYVKSTRYSSSKYIKENEIYYVENEKTTSSSNYRRYDKKFKIRGVRNYLSTYKFKELSVTEQRNIKLKNLNGIKTITGEQTRKFLLYTEKEKLNILIELLFKIINDIKCVESKNKISLISLFLKKGKIYNIQEEDVKPFLKNIKTLLKPYNKLLKYD